MTTEVAGVERFSLRGRVAVVTGGTGVLGGAITRGLAAAGAAVAVLGRRADRAQQVVASVEDAGGSGLAVSANVLDRDQLEQARAATVDAFDGIDVLVNAAGGNQPGAMIEGEQTFFSMPRDAFDAVLDLNLGGTVLSTQVFGEAMAERSSSSVINISSMAATQALTRVLGYSVAKSGVDSLTRWLAMEMAHRYGDRFRVNAIAPGFFLGEQNRDLLVDDDGELTERGELIIRNTPAGRFGEPDELVGIATWLASDASRFVTGAVIPVDGGFSVFSGV